MENMQDKALWLTAKRRAAFKKGLVAYVLVNAFLWCIYLLTNSRIFFPWPLWVMLGWGIGLALKYVEAYQGESWFSIEREYNKLKSTEK